MIFKRVPPEEMADMMERHLTRTSPDVAREFGRGLEAYRDDCFDFMVTVYRDKAGSVRCLRVRYEGAEVTYDQAHDWGLMQEIKNQFAGEEAEAFELYPAESRLVDVDDTYWIFVLPPGDRMPGVGLYLDENNLRHPIIDGLIPEGGTESPRDVKMMAEWEEEGGGLT